MVEFSIYMLLYSIRYMYYEYPKRRVFLAGPMRGMYRRDSLAWRERATELLGETFAVRHAMRQRGEEETMPNSQSAVIRDLKDISDSDILLVNDTVKNVSMIGTSMEIMYAHLKEKIVIAFGDAHTGDYFMDRHVPLRFPTLEDAVQFLITFYE